MNTVKYIYNEKEWKDLDASKWNETAINFKKTSIRKGRHIYQVFAKKTHQFSLIERLSRLTTAIIKILPALSSAFIYKDNIPLRQVKKLLTKDHRCCYLLQLQSSDPETSDLLKFTDSYPLCKSQIFSFLSLKDRMTFRVCLNLKQDSSLVSADDEVNTLLGYLNEKKLSLFLEEKGPLITYLNLSKIKKQLTFDLLLKIIKYCPFLTTLDLNHCDQLRNKDLKALAPLTCLTTLHLNACFHITDEGLKALAPLTHLTMLNLNMCFHITDEGLKALAPLTGLTTLNLSFCDHLTEEGLKALAPLTSLTTLNLSWCHQLTGKDLKALVLLTGLTSLDLSMCHQLTHKDLKALAPLTRLTSLNLIMCRQLTDKSLKVLALLTGLKTLNLTGCHQLTDEGLKALAPLTRLTTLNLIGCHQLTDESLKALALLTGLKTLNLSEYQLTDEGLKALAPSIAIRR